MELKTCANVQCPHPNPQPLTSFPTSRGESRRTLCESCYRAHKRVYQRQRRQGPTIAVAAEHYNRGGCEGCTMVKRCRDGRLWMDGPLPCEALLADEIGLEFDPDSSPTLLVIPLRVNVELPV